MLVRRIEPIKEICSRHAVKFDQVADQVFVDHGCFDSADRVFFQDRFGFFRVSDVSDVFPVDGMKVTRFDPGVEKSRFFKGGSRIFVGRKDQAGRM